MVQSMRGTLVIEEGDKIAQLLLLPSLHALLPSKNRRKTEKEQKSTEGIFEGLHMSLEHRPMLTIKVQGRPLLGLLDTGADRSIIRQQEWPSAWPTCRAEETLNGIGQVSTPMLSATALHWADDEGHQGSFQPYVLPLPISLWGRDVLTQMDVTLISNCSPTSKHLLKGMGYVPGKGLGASLQGRTVPVQTVSNPDKRGLGFS
ncbi:endogenous retrovirus group K member 7 Pro protein-like [Tamandua tetradactyla]|uniref:endogenous retrovirus group K member 7 Pro protein-like n=1 Tax=Tamandua tetradactyla TaxID=48850 RepID=UPI0040542B66